HRRCAHWSLCRLIERQSDHIAPGGSDIDLFRIVELPQIVDLCFRIQCGSNQNNRMLKRFDTAIANNRSSRSRDHAIRGDVVSELSIDTLIELLLEIAGKKKLCRAHLTDTSAQVGKVDSAVKTCDFPYRQGCGRCDVLAQIRRLALTFKGQRLE